MANSGFNLDIEMFKHANFRKTEAAAAAKGPIDTRRKVSSKVALALKLKRCLRNGESNKKRVDIFCDHHRSKSSSSSSRARVASRRQTCHDLNQRETLQNTTLKGKIIGLAPHNVSKSLKNVSIRPKISFLLFLSKILSNISILAVNKKYKQTAEKVNKQLNM